MSSDFSEFFSFFWILMISLIQPRTNNWGVAYLLLESKKKKIYIIKNNILLVVDLSLFSTLVFFFNHWFMSIWNHAYSFYSFGYNSALLYWTSCFSFGHWRFSPLVPISLLLTIIFVLLLCTPLIVEHKVLYTILYISWFCPRISHFSKES